MNSSGPQTRTAGGALNVLYIETGHSGAQMLVICGPELRLTKSELTSVASAIESTDRRISSVRESSAKDDSHFVLSVNYHNNPTDAQKAALHDAVGARYFSATAFAKVIRAEAGQHRDTFMRLHMPTWAAERVVARMSSVATVTQFATTPDSNYHGRSFVAFTTTTVTRDPQRIREQMAEIAERLDVWVTNPQFRPEDNLIYATMASCNHPDDPADARPGDAA